jgi:hypothetical protein
MHFEILTIRVGEYHDDYCNSTSCYLDDSRCCGKGCTSNKHPCSLQMQVAHPQTQPQFRVVSHTRFGIATIICENVQAGQGPLRVAHLSALGLVLMPITQRTIGWAIGNWAFDIWAGHSKSIRGVYCWCRGNVRVVIPIISARPGRESACAI